jgi:iron complex outermembrane receptor protein
MAQTGFRMDWMPSAENTVTVQGDIYGGDEEMPAPGDTTLNGQNLLARWTHVVSQDSDFRLQVYADRTWRNIPGTFGENLRTYDIDFSHRFQLGERQAITWGAGYRLMQDEVKNTATLAFIPPKRDMQLFSGFLQDEIVLVPEKLKLTLGTKLEHNDFSGLELQPSARLAWLLDKRQALWAAVSRAVRSPSRIDTDLFVPGQSPFFIAGGKSFTSEKLIAYEVGYHVRPVDRWSISVATYYNQYDDIRSVETNGASLAIQNGLQGQSWGAEISTDFQVSDWWRLRGGYTYFHKDVWEKPGHADFSNAKGEGNDPHHQFLLQSMLNLPLNLEFDVAARYVSSLPNPRVPEYFTFDARLAWHWKKNLEVAVIGQNLWDNQHPEFGAAAGRQEIPRSVYGKVSLRF